MISTSMLHGADWVKADFHLHTKADKEFKYSEDPSTDFAKEFIMKLKEAGIGVGVITNHNKFDREEYRQLAKKAVKDGILLLSGVELSVADGSNGVHVLIVFDPDTWLHSDENFIEQFLTVAFEGIKNRENENARCKFNLLELMNRLETHRKEGRDSFCILAHVEQKSGFLTELEGGRIQEFGSNQLFRESVLGLQKMRTRDLRDKLTGWWNGALPALVEGSDCKCIAEIGLCGTSNGKNHETFLKLGSLSFSAVKFGLISPERISESKPEHTHAYIRKISFTGGIHDGREIPLSRNLNCLVGIRGSGKSSVLEAVRYGLAVELGCEAKDYEYKSDLVKNTIGSGGKITIEIVDKHERIFTITRVYGEQPRISLNGEPVEQFDLADQILEAKYFGQKDLSEIGTQGFANDLVEKFFSDSLKSTREAIRESVLEVSDICARIESIDSSMVNKDSLLKEKAGLDQQMQVFKDKDIHNKLNRQITYKSCLELCDDLIGSTGEFGIDAKKVAGKLRNSLTEFVKNEFDIDNELKTTLTAAVASLKAALETVFCAIAQVNTDLKSVTEARKSIAKVNTDLEDEFAEVRRECQLTKLDPEEFIKMQSRLSEIEKQLKAIDSSERSRTARSKDLKQNLNKLNDLWNKEFQLLKKQLDSLNDEGLAITFKCEFKGDKEHFASFLQEFFSKTGVQKNRISDLAANYPDTHQLYDDFISEENGNVSKIISSTDTRLRLLQRIEDNRGDFLSYRVPDKVTLLYRGIPIAKHSLGQRATAVVLFLLKCGRGSLLLIDQPEDDLDSQSIFQEIISELLRKKETCQFIFATHNPNVPVLGDCEQLIRCKTDENGTDCLIGGIDNPEIQSEIVNIMEGGEEAFKRRKQIYQFWAC